MTLGEQNHNSPEASVWHLPIRGAGNEETGVRQVQPSCGNRGSPSRAGIKGLGSCLDSVLEPLGLAGLWRGAVHRCPQPVWTVWVVMVMVDTVSFTGSRTTGRQLQTTWVN